MSLPTRPSADDLSNLSKLKISTKPRAKKADVIADSWEDESDGSDTETEEVDDEERLAKTTTTDPPSVPPPTPASPTTPDLPAMAYGPRGEQFSSDIYTSMQPRLEKGSRSPDRRPDKTTSVAARLIAGGLGVKAPKRTEEQREYDKAMREKEKRRREEEKKAKEEEEKAKRSVWED
ncbi:uncharacterized protein PV09_05446 [Verruconis gallopava]|uniref:Uncharacterized protein n=1 Tax=Verruconis gallopava TaxID=253628 RepID=A0A0D1YRH7_9PEZI|nr:uncharacterized protein PV09_05446 [Verruconis gallopava]KIW03222.1 hypothetical protein PV09_05446 [Verruconis gallopava]